MKTLLISILVAMGTASVTEKTYLHRIKSYLNSRSAKTKSKYLSEDYHSFFQEKTGEGKNKATAIKSFLNWDAPLHPDVAILNYSVDGNKWKVEFNEQNDFSKLIGFPGWKGTEMITFNSKKKICETIYLPNDGNPDYKQWLRPALDWLQNNQAAALTEVYQNGKLIQTPQTAQKWVNLLRLWRKETTPTN